MENIADVFLNCRDLFENFEQRVSKMCRKK